MYKKYLIFTISLLILNQTLPSYGQGSGYYDMGLSRPPSAFSICCCRKEGQNEKQVFYSCEKIESDGCPENTKKYNVSPTQCPATIMFTK